MLPTGLSGPGKLIGSTGFYKFLTENTKRFPNLHPEFISQICYEHPTRFNNLFPKFNPSIYGAVVEEHTVEWVRNNVRYDDNEELDFWFKDFDTRLETGSSGYSIFDFMIRNKSWPFSPVIIEKTFAAEIGAMSFIGEPYYLIEGTHRISYLLRMSQLGKIPLSKNVPLIKVKPI